MSLERQLKRNKEKEELKKIHKIYGKKPKELCPRCHKKSLFLINKDNEVFCVRCNEVVRRWE